MKCLFIDNKITADDLLKPFRGYVNPCIQDNLKRFDVLAIYDAPIYLPFWYQKLKKLGFNFKYHVVVYFDPLDEFKVNNLLVSHVGVLLLSKNSFKPNKVRIPHKFCKFCKEPLKDWGGKKHLMHPEGTLISDVWKDFEITYKDIANSTAPDVVIERINQMFEDVEVLLCKRDIIRLEDCEEYDVNEPNIQDKIILGDAVEKLKEIPSNSIDTIFIDPPYNLGKDYLSYEDERRDYVEWSLKWLNECFRVLKPKGSLFLLNIPKWAHELLPILTKDYYVQRWIVWDEQAEPRGKLIPAHYSLLWFSKTKDVKTFPIGDDQDSMEYCLRLKCIRMRRSMGVKDKIAVRDVRWDIHRIKHRGKRFKYHPAQLPERLLEFVIKLTTEEGDIILDPMVGTGTTVVVAKRLKRRYIGIDIEPRYVEITEKRLKGLLILEEPKEDDKKEK